MIPPLPKLERHVCQYIEGELYVHHARKKHIDRLREYIATERPGWDDPTGQTMGGSRPAGRVSDPTFARVVRIEQDKELRAVESQWQRVENGLRVLSPAEKEVITQVYLTRRLTISQVAESLDLTDRHVRRLRHSAFWQLGVAMGVIST